jgi:hypothetical protein
LQRYASRGAPKIYFRALTTRNSSHNAQAQHQQHDKHDDKDKEQDSGDIKRRARDVREPKKGRDQPDHQKDKCPSQHWKILARIEKETRLKRPSSLPRRSVVKLRGTFRLQGAFSMRAFPQTFVEGTAYEYPFGDAAILHAHGFKR